MPYRLPRMSKAEISRLIGNNKRCWQLQLRDGSIGDGRGFDAAAALLARSKQRNDAVMLQR
jgi:hypothetical protein